MIEHKFPYESFIGGWYISEKVCDELINFYNINKHLAKSGTLGYNNGVMRNNKDAKESMDLSVHKEYWYHPLNDYRLELQKCLDKFVEKYYYSNQTNYFDINENYNIQYYKPNQGFKHWHCERGDYKNSGARHLVFMTYLNDVDDGGTEFFHQKLTCPAKKGLTILWPVDWTHTHKGQISKTKEKYIVTGWYSYNE